MVNNKKKIIILLSIAVIFFTIMFSTRHDEFPLLIPLIFAHCDTMNGPVIQTAQKALDTGNINLVLIWVQKQDEAEIKKTFEKTLAVRKLGPEAKELADKYFFETLVRIHRAGEGTSYTGIQPAGAEVEPGIEAADKALETGSVDALIKEVSNNVSNGIKERFNKTMEKKKHMNESIDAGREYVEAYVTFIHYVEKLVQTVTGESAHHSEKEKEEAKPEEHHK